MSAADDREVIEFIRDIADNFDCDDDAHRYNTTCRSCEASKLLVRLGHGSLLRDGAASRVRIEAREEREGGAC